VIEPERFRKKPVEIEAVRFTGGAVQATSIIEWVLANGGTARYHDGPVEGIAVDTIDGGTSYVYVGSWMMRGTQGEFYPCVNEAFEESFERLVGENDHAKVYVDSAGEWRFTVQAGNNRVIASSEEGYVSKSNALRALKREHPHVAYITEETEA
jgi:uncharacterized protein YegP (UPF0339 family)